MLQASPSTLPSITDLLTRGKQAAMSGQRDLAREMLAYVVYLEPANADGWLWLSGVVDSPEQVRYCLERTLRIEPHNQRALRGLEWLDARQREIDEARAAAERVKPYWQTTRPKPLLNLVKKNAEEAQGMAATGETASSSRPMASWTAISASIPNSRTARSNAPTMPVSAETLAKFSSELSAAPVKDPVYRDEVLAADDDLAPRFVTGTAISHLWHAVEKVTGAPALETMLKTSGLSDLVGYFPEADETPAINYTRFSAFAEAMEEFYGPAVEAMELRVGREMFRQELNMKGKMLAAKGISFKLMSPERKLHTMLMELADAHARMGMESFFEEREGGYLFVIETCPYCFGRLTNARCSVTKGFLLAGIEWATGRTLEIDEVSCRGLDEPYCGYWVPS
ncbi:MAG TPA: hypothetical protein VFR15_03560 [Chloroflexia bacterium]|nr:hypothetical protein [Chloroflexia bacterium]